MNIEKIGKRCLIQAAAMAIVLSNSCPSSLGQEGRGGVDWSKLDLNATQAKQTEEIDSQWHRDYAQLQPSIDDDQKKLAKLLLEHHSDAVEIMSLYSSIARKREQLGALAIAAYLRKRECLTDTQQHTLETMMVQSMADHEHSMAGGVLTEMAPDRIQGLIQRMRSVWTDSGEHQNSQ
jgi:hypothetical protein